MRVTSCLLFAAVAVFASFAVPAGDIALPQPQKTGGTPLFEAMDARGSAGQTNFPSKRLDWNDFSTILWAASGHNRDGVKWTVPMAMGKPPYCKVYVTLDEGVFVYDWQNHILKQTSTKNVKADIPSQAFAKQVPAALYIVADGEALSGFDNPVWAEEFGKVLAGAMSQNVYLACDALGVGARLAYSIDRGKAHALLGLGPKDTALFVILLGKR